MTVKEELHREIEQLSEVEAGLWLAALRGDRLAWTLLHAPSDDEPITEAEQAAVRKRRRTLPPGALAPGTHSSATSVCKPDHCGA